MDERTDGAQAGVAHPRPAQGPGTVPDARRSRAEPRERLFLLPLASGLYVSGAQAVSGAACLKKSFFTVLNQCSHDEERPQDNDSLTHEHLDVVSLIDLKQAPDGW
ncbi:hypothetical protein NDU88_000618 [Pleurodeles waltl]|uniref:Uncharacterized protein n=1 Tax=Pleurodeles waltl TaxID=8319 RepID=A0AAV7MHC7_PLEWA|nr:hypothetical protein NDU88_000618 [Pleurodeles waltl]